jgi:hypothetical protein
MHIGYCFHAFLDRTSSSDLGNRRRYGRYDAEAGIAAGPSKAGPQQAQQQFTPI